MIEVNYKSSSNNACRGRLKIKVDGKEIYNKDHCCTSTGSTYFTEGYRESHVEIGELIWDDADKFSRDIQLEVKEELSKVTCCGGCL